MRKNKNKNKYKYKWILAVFLIYSLFIPSAFAKTELILSDLPVQWQQAERWHWQGQHISSQRFSSEQDITHIAMQIQETLHQVNLDLRVQRLASAWLLSFDDMTTQTHYLLLLSVQRTGTAGWLSTMQLQDNVKEVAALVPPVLFNGLYKHSWSLRDPDTNRSHDPLYALLQPVNQSNRLWQQLHTRLAQQAWQGGNCAKEQWCQWQKESQRLWLWVDPKQELWHVLWWPKLRGE